MYPAQMVPGGTKAVTFRGRPGAKLRQLENNAANVTFDGLEVDGRSRRPRLPEQRRNSRSGTAGSAT